MRHLVGALLLAGEAFVLCCAALAQAFSQDGKAAGGGFGDVAVGLARFEALGRCPDAAQQGQVARLVHLVDGDDVRGAGVADELDAELVRHDQDGRGAERQAVEVSSCLSAVSRFCRGPCSPTQTRHA